MQQMEAILSKLLVADNAIILEGTNELREAFKNPGAISALCVVLGTSSNPQIRQYAAVLLRKKLTKHKQWLKLTKEDQTIIKQGILEVLINEKEKFVKNSVAQFIGTVAKHEMAQDGWPELLKLLQTLLSSDVRENIELGIYTLSVITGVSHEAFSKQMDSFSVFFVNTLQNTECLLSPIGYYTVVTMTNLIPLLEVDQNLRSAYLTSLPAIVNLVKHLSSTDEEKACECIELLYELSETSVPVVIPHLKIIIEMSLEIGQNKSLDGTIRNKAIHLLGWLSKIGKKSLIKNKLVDVIVSVLFEIMCEPMEGDEEERCFTFDDEEDDMTSNAAAYVLDTLGLNLPPQKVVAPALKLVETHLASDNIYAKRACYVCIAVLSKGCSDYIRTKYLKLFLECVGKGLTDNAPIIRNAALYALGQFAEHLQPDISEYASELMPILFEYLSQLCQRLKHKSTEPAGVVSMFFALETFCQNLEEKLVPYLPTLMERLLLCLDPSHSIHIQELTLSAISCAALAAKEAMLPYFQPIMEKLKCYLMQKHEGETICLQVQAVGTLSILARHLGQEHFQSLSLESLTLGKKLISESKDPDLKQAVYNLFGALSTIMKEDMAVYLPELVDMCIASLNSTEGVVAHYKDDEDSAFPVYEDLSENEDEVDLEVDSDGSNDDEDVEYTVENPYLEEKEEACSALMEFAENTGSAFLVYIKRCFEEVYKLIEYPHEDIKKAAIETLTKFCISFSKVDTPEGKQSLLESLALLIPKIAERVRMDDEQEVVVCALDAFSELLNQVKHPVLEGEGHREAIINCIKDVLNYKTECQEKPDDEEEQEDAEQDELLIETAGDIIPKFGKILPPNEFVLLLREFLPTILNKLKQDKSDSQRSFFVGTIAECIPLASSELTAYAPELLNIFLPLTKDEDHEVRNNAVYGLGELVFHSKDALFPRYGEILVALSVTLSSESDPGTLDNICGAIAKLIVTNINLIPMDQVFPVLLQNLPLKKDFEENKSVLNCFGHLYQLGHPLLKQHIGCVIRVCISVVHNKQGDEDTIQLALQMLALCRKDFTQDFTLVLAELPPEVSLNINQL